MKVRDVLIFFLGFSLCLAGTGGLILAQEGAGDIMSELKLFHKAMGAILEGYVGTVNPRGLFYEAVRGMAKSLDKYSEFIDPEKYELLRINMEGEYAGIGTWITESEGMILVHGIRPGTPAAKANIEIGDRILKVDGIETAGKDVGEIGALMRGEAGTSVILTLAREFIPEPFDVEVVRETIEIDAVKDVRLVGRAVGYMHLADWNEHTVEQADRALEELEQKGMQALILDLRGNSGGLLNKAVDLAERFLPAGAEIISVESKIGVQRNRYSVQGRDKIYEIPLILLVNQDSASASEIFTAAMQANGRATVVGTKTYGKASVQSVVPLDEVSALRLTTARYKTPAGDLIDEVGIMPDIEQPDELPGNAASQQQIKKALEIFKDYY